MNQNHTITMNTQQMQRRPYIISRSGAISRNMNHRHLPRFGQQQQPHHNHRGNGNNIQGDCFNGHNSHGGPQPHSSRPGGSGMPTDRRIMNVDRRMNNNNNPSLMDRQMNHYDPSSSHRNSDMDNRSLDGHRHNRERISPHSSNYQDSNQGNGMNIKSDSPSRKRRRLQRMPSQSPPTIWENNNNQLNQNQSNHNSYHHHQNRRLSPRQYHNGPQNSPPIRRQRFRDQQQQPQPPRPWDINPTPVFQQPSPPHHAHTHHSHSQHSMMVEMNHQVPVSLPLGHEQIWTYPAPHISISPAAPHLPPQCQVHNVYS